MIKKILSTSAPLAALLLISKAIVTESAAEAYVVPPKNSYQVSVEESLQALKQCKSGAINVFFHDEYIGFHSANVTHDAFSAAENCRVMNIEVVLYETDNAQRTTDNVKTELKAIADAHGYVSTPKYRVIEVDETDQSLNNTTYLINGLAAKIQFDLDIESETDQS